MMETEVVKREKTEEEKEILRQQRKERRKQKKLQKALQKEAEAKEKLKESESPPKQKTTKKRKRNSIPISKSKKVYIGNLVFDVTEEDIKNAFSNYEIKSIEMPLDPNTGKFYGVCFIVFKSHEIAEKAVQEMNGVELKRRPMIVEFKSSTKKTKVKESIPNDGRTLFIAGINDDVTDDDLIQLFSKIGKLVRIRRMYDKVTKEFRGSAFIEFETKFSASQALKFHHKIFHNRKLRIEYAKEKTIV